MRSASTRRSAQPSKRTKRSQAAARVPPKGAAAGSKQTFNAADFLAHPGLGRTIVERPRGSHIFSQGDSADAIFYLQKGRVKVTTVSKTGKEAIIALLAPEEFVGEECIASAQPLRLTTATALVDCVLLKIGREEMVRALGQEHALSEVFVSFLLKRNARIQEDLVDQLFNKSEKRLARILLLLAHFGKNGPPEPVIPKLSQEALAEMVGTTRSRVSLFMNRFRKMGFIRYNGEIQVHNSLLNVVLHD